MKAILFLLMLVAFGCSKVQYTSGSQYLKGYSEVPKDGLDKDVYDVANIEPNLKFPARIGLARIDNGVLTVIPEAEMKHWNKLAEESNSAFGDFIPVNHLIASMVSKPRVSKDSYRVSHEERLHEIIRTLRLGAARQHLDVVYIYEVYGSSRSYVTPAYIANITVIGAYLLPGRRIKAKGFASGLLLDVRNGYPYGTTEACLVDSELSTSANAHHNEHELVEELKSKAGIKLVDETRDMMNKLKTEMLLSVSAN